MHKSHYTLIAGLLLACTMQSPALAQEPGQDGMQTIVWPMQAGESLRDLAVLIYPKNRAMQQRLIATTLRLNGEALAGRTADQPFEAGEDILLPDPRALSAYARPAPKRKSLPRLPAPAAGMDTQVQAVPVTSTPADTAALEQRNQSRKQDLESLNQRLNTLQTEAAKMQQSIEKNKAALPPAKP